MRRNLKKELKNLYNSVPAPDPEGMENLLAMAKRRTPAIAGERSMYRFILSQFKFIDRRILAIQLLLLCLYGVLVSVVLRDETDFLLLVPAAPLVIMLGSSELSRSFRFNMAELEMASKYSLSHVLLARLVIAATLDTLSLSAMLALTALNGYGTIGSLILYGLVPGFVAAAGSLLLINRCKIGSIQYCVCAYCASLSVFGAVSVEEWPKWYDGTAIAVWLLILLLAAVSLALELYKLLRSCSNRQVKFQ